MGREEEAKQYLEHTGLISERKFASSHSGFWQDALPFSENFVRRANLRSVQVGKPVRPDENVEHRALVGELAFRLFCTTIDEGRLRLPVRKAEPDVVSETISYLRHFEDWSSQTSGPSSAELRESEELAQRLTDSFIGQLWIEGLLPRPAFPGCGFLVACEGDVLVKDILVEVKTVERAFRVVDFRQILTYLALNWASKSFSIKQVAIVNPRRGRLFRLPVSDLCFELSGRSETDFFEEITLYVSADEEPQ